MGHTLLLQPFAALVLGNGLVLLTADLGLLEPLLVDLVVAQDFARALDPGTGCDLVGNCRPQANGFLENVEGEPPLDQLGTFVPVALFDFVDFLLQTLERFFKLLELLSLRGLLQVVQAGLGLADVLETILPDKIAEFAQEVAVGAKVGGDVWMTGHVPA